MTTTTNLTTEEVDLTPRPKPDLFSCFRVCFPSSSHQNKGAANEEDESMTENSSTSRRVTFDFAENSAGDQGAEGVVAGRGLDLTELEATLEKKDEEGSSKPQPLTVVTTKEASPSSLTTTTSDAITASDKLAEFWRMLFSIIFLGYFARYQQNREAIEASSSSSTTKSEKTAEEPEVMAASPVSVE